MLRLRSITSLCLFLVAAAAAWGAPARPDGPIRDWVVLGPFPNSLPAEGRVASARGGFDIDFLTGIGGETGAALREGVTVALPAGGSAAARSAQATGGRLDFLPVFPDSANKLAYAYAVVQSPSEQAARLYVGSDDGAKLWLNGKLVLDVYPLAGRAYAARENAVDVRLRAGDNPILVKVENGTGDWAVGVEVYAGRSLKKLQAAEENAARTRQLMGLEVAPTQTVPGWVFHVGDFPKLAWRDPDQVRRLLGRVPALEVRWFGPDGEPVTRAEKPGRYGAVVQARLKGGALYRRGLTFAALPAGTWNLGDWRLAVRYPGPPFDEAAWSERKPLVDGLTSNLLSEALWSTPQGARYLAAYLFMKPLGRPGRFVDGCDVADGDYHVALKRQTLAGLPAARPLAPPRKRGAGPAPVIREGTAAEAGVVLDARERINEAARNWEKDSGEPFSLLVARHGVIVAHAGFGSLGADGPCTVDFRNEVASITKAVSGILFSQFVDQGLVQIDDPIGAYLPGLPVKGPKALTYRHCFTHTSGLSGHGEYGGIWNTDLDNVYAAGIAALEPSVRHNYNGMGYDLAGRAMEMITGKSIVRLFTDHLFTPLGFTDVPIVDMAYGAQLTARELAVLGQWLANKGSYGDLEFVTPQTYAQLLPRPLKEYWPAIDVEWGIGLTHMPVVRPGVTGQPRPQDYALGPKTIGHGSATSCVLRVDPDQDLVIAMIRRTAGPRYDANLAAFCAAVADALKK